MTKPVIFKEARQERGAVYEGCEIIPFGANKSSFVSLALKFAIFLIFLPV